MSRRRDEERVRGLERAMDGLRGQLDELGEMVEANSGLAQGVRGAQECFERE